MNKYRRFHSLSDIQLNSMARNALDADAFLAEFKKNLDFNVLSTIAKEEERMRVSGLSGIGHIIALVTDSGGDTVLRIEFWRDETDAECVKRELNELKTAEYWESRQREPV